MKPFICYWLKYTTMYSVFSVNVIFLCFLVDMNFKEVTILYFTGSKKNSYHVFLTSTGIQYTKRKTESYVFSGFGVGISRGWEWKSTAERFATGRFWPFTWKTSFVGKDKVTKWEFCKWKITTTVVFLIMIQRIFPY